MCETHKKAQMRLNNIVPIHELRPTERVRNISQMKVIGRFARKRKFKARDVDMFKPKRPILETLIGSFESNRIIRPIDEWVGA